MQKYDMVSPAVEKNIFDFSYTILMILEKPVMSNTSLT